MRYTKNPYSSDSKKTSRMSSAPFTDLYQSKETSILKESKDPIICLDDVENLPMVCVDWVDAVCSGGSDWQSFEDIEEAVSNGPSKVRTVGMLLKETEEFIALCDTIIMDGDSGGYVHVIPKGMILTLKVLN